MKLKPKQHIKKKLNECKAKTLLSNKSVSPEALENHTDHLQ